MSPAVRTVLAGTVALIVGIQLYRFLLWSPAQLTTHDLLADDAFFYSVLAKNFWRFGFLTLDGHMPTNGVQPLWMWTQIALARVFPHVDTATILVRSTWISYVAFSFLTVSYVARGPAIAAVLRTVLVAGLVLLNLRFQAIVVLGLETSLFLVVLIATLMMCDAWLGARSTGSRRDLSTPRAIAIACGASLCFLARTDAFWIFLVVAAWIALRVHRPASALVVLGVVGSALVLPYLANNLWTHGSLMPISGRAKLFYLSAFLPDRASYLASDEWRALFAALPALIRLPTTVAVSSRFAITLTLLVAGMFTVWRMHRLGRLPAGLAILTWAILGHILFMQFAYRELRVYTSYYFAAEMWWLAICATLWLSPPEHGRRQAVAALAAVAIVGFTGFEWATRKLEPSIYWIERINLAEDIKRLPADAKVGGFWPGCFAAFSGRGIVPLDGIVGSNEYFQKYVKTGKELNYLRDQRIEYVAMYLPESLDAILSREQPPSLSNWSFTHVRRLWENRSVPISIVAKRTFGKSDVGWYLLRFGG